VKAEKIIDLSLEVKPDEVCGGTVKCCIICTGQNNSMNSDKAVSVAGM